MKPVAYNASHPEIDGSTKATGTRASRRVASWFLHELREILPPIIFFFIGFHLVVLTTNLILADYRAAFGSFMLTTAAALVVGKAVLVANKMALLRRYDRAPLIQPILFKTFFYWAVVFVLRLQEHFVQFTLVEHNQVSSFPQHMVATFSWHRFAAIQLWIFVLFLIYVTAAELNHLFGEGELRRLFFTRRPSELQLNRRQQILELVRLSKLADAHSVAEFRDPNSIAHSELIDIVRRLAAEPQPHAAAE